MSKVNEELVHRYPFLRVDKEHEYTMLDGLPTGWISRFAIPMLEDLREILVKNNVLDDYKLLDVKEKWGSLRWYDNLCLDETEEIIDAYEYISSHTCINCGAFPVPMRTKGWISPLCGLCFDCKKEDRDKYTVDDYNGRLLEYYNGIDMKSYYKKVGWDYNNLVTEKDLSQYEEYKKALIEWEDKNGPIEDGEIIPYEIQEMNPFRRDK